jgi:hypothetical protein
MNKTIKQLAAGAVLCSAPLPPSADPDQDRSVPSVTGPAAFHGDPDLKTLAVVR